jgi:ATP-dependent DNA ligase
VHAKPKDIGRPRELTYFVGAQIGFTEWTPDNHLRHAKFIGLRQDKKAGDVVREPG